MILTSYFLLGQGWIIPAEIISQCMLRPKNRTKPTEKIICYSMWWLMNNPVFRRTDNVLSPTPSPWERSDEWMSTPVINGVAMVRSTVPAWQVVLRRVRSGLVSSPSASGLIAEVGRQKHHPETLLNPRLAETPAACCVVNYRLTQISLAFQKQARFLTRHM